MEQTGIGMRALTHWGAEAIVIQGGEGRKVERDGKFSHTSKSLTLEADRLGVMLFLFKYWWQLSQFHSPSVLWVRGSAMESLPPIIH